MKAYAPIIGIGSGMGICMGIGIGMDIAVVKKTHTQ